MDRKIFAGARMRHLRESRGLTQSAMARDLGVSASYLNLVEHNQRPLTAQLLLKLATTYAIDLRDLGGENEARMASELAEALADPVVADPRDPAGRPGPAEINDAVTSSPRIARALVTLYRAWRRNARQADDLASLALGRDRRPVADDDRFPIEEVRDYFHARGNHVAELDTAAEELAAALPGPDRMAGLIERLRERHGLAVTILPVHVMPDMQRRHDHHTRRLFLSELLPRPSRCFQVAVQIALMEHGELMDQLVAGAGFRTAEARSLCRIGLANYFAGAVMMPYAGFLEAARRCRYDVTVLAARFDASIEQVAHRLTTLQRPDARGIPFFLLRVDNAGNVSKRFAAGGFHFARHGGTCPRWRVHDAFATPGQTIIQPVEMPDGTVYLTVSRTVDTLPVPHPGSPRRLAISLGCEIGHAPNVAYGDGLDLSSPAAVTPIGATCRLCERPNCTARAFPPMTRPLVIDGSRKNLSAFEFG
ncbi:short-chain fatty acyl-CoA regulator family protein [Tistrella mobilis]|jgi:predicted transcriptional regulator/transcriptional regulator with XRE-family HTH domain|uniref:helix-turn-helix domain-containing protein n=1 Tax=Tistrella mobilis TaxID=171437 RepID=UPI0035560888